MEQIRVKPRIIIHGGAGNIQPSNLPPEQYREYRSALLDIITKTHAYMTRPLDTSTRSTVSEKPPLCPDRPALPSALQTATYAVTLLEDNALFNSGHGAVFTRDGTNELEASVMVSKGHKKRAVGVSGIRDIKNPILLAKAILEAGEDDMEKEGVHGSSNTFKNVANDLHDVPSAQGHSHLHGPVLTSILAKKYDLDLVQPEYFFTQRRWDEHVRSLKRAKQGHGILASWSDKDYLPQGTCGAVALDEDGVVCVATSTGGLTNKLSGRVGDTPTVGAGFWAGEWEVDEGGARWPRGLSGASLPYSPWSSWSAFEPLAAVNQSLRRLLSPCLPSLHDYAVLVPSAGTRFTKTTRSFGASGTGNGDSFLRLAAVRSVGARAQWKLETGQEALTAIAGAGGELQRSAGERWGKTGEGQGGMIGIEVVVHRDDRNAILAVKSQILQDFNCGGMFRAWIDDDDVARAQVWRDHVSWDDTVTPPFEELEEDPAWSAKV